MNIKEIVSLATRDYRVRLSEIQLEQLETYYELLKEWNERMNLTAITDPEGVAVKHFADSLSLLNCVDIEQNAKIIDIGTGAGFPGLVLKIARPDIQLTLLDSLNKRLLFLEETASRLELEVELLHSRAEDGAKKAELRENFDFAVARAVAQLNVLSEYCLPYVRPGGKFIAMKGPQTGEETAKSKKAVQTLGGRVSECFEFSLPLHGGDRTIIVINKIKSTPKGFPRSSGQIKSKPLLT